MAFIEIFKANLFKNKERFEGSTPITGGKPNYSNGKITIASDIPAGTYGISGWQYPDTGNISITFQRITQDDGYTPSPEPITNQGGDDDTFIIE
tara:strand:- start:513 stop:794 length:282 start_codon:yes stop_codon:yes gene_type:complete